LTQATTAIERTDPGRGRYSRIVLKISGEALMGRRNYGVDPEVTAFIAAQIHDRWTVCAVALLHATGTLAVGRVSVVVAVSAPHRAEAFEAARFGIEELKRDVPIWKKEARSTGDAEWVMGA